VGSPVTATLPVSGPSFACSIVSSKPPPEPAPSHVPGHVPAYCSGFGDPSGPRCAAARLTAAATNSTHQIHGFLRMGLS
jgi:hypothetical protein